jgi:hypothetical protein
MSLLLLMACSGASDPDERLVLGPEIACEVPTDGFLRFEEVGVERGLDRVHVASEDERSCPVVPGGVVAEDMDADGDIDLLFHRVDAFPVVYANDGTGHFDQVSVDVGWSDDHGRLVHALALADWDDDGLPEVFVVSESLVAMSRNLGGLNFSAFEVLYDAPGLPRTCNMSLAFGDVDGDGDLDVLLPGADLVPEEDFVMALEPPWAAGIDRLLLQDQGALTQVLEITRGDPEALALVAMFSDWDDDGDMDVFFGSDRVFAEGTVPLGWFRNHGNDAGLPVLKDEAAELGGSILVNVMGFGSGDLNADGVIDFCFTDLAPSLTCQLSDGAGSFYGGGRSLGLVPSIEDHPDLPSGTTQGEIDDAVLFWTTWGMELEDLDNDGFLDLAVVSGGVPERGNVAFSPISEIQVDSLFQGSADGFVNQSHASGFNDVTANFGLVVADFEEDGALDLVVGPHEGTPAFWSNPCTVGSWLKVELVGPPGNRDGFGARVTVTRDGVAFPDELHGPRLGSQRPSSLHFGLGDATQVDRLTVRWPDGASQTFDDVPGRRVVTVWHPDAK